MVNYIEQHGQLVNKLKSELAQTKQDSDLQIQDLTNKLMVRFFIKISYLTNTGV